MNTDRSLTFHKRLVTDERVQSAVAAATAAQAEFVAGMKQIMPLLYPEQERATLKSLMQTETDTTVLAEALRRINELTGEGAKVAQDRASILAKKLLAEFSKPIDALVKAGEEAADDLIADAVKAEMQLYGAFKFAYQPTAISDAARQTKAQLRSLNHRSSSDAHVLAMGMARVRPGIHREVLAFFKQ